MIAVIGSINMDLVVMADRAPDAGETVLGNNFYQVFGGKGANQAVAAARCGAETTMVGRVGNDSFGETILKGLKREFAEGAAIVQVFEGTAGLKLEDTRVRFRGHPLNLAVSGEMLGRAFDGLGRPFDGGPEPIGEDRDVNGLPVNPTARDYPHRSLCLFFGYQDPAHFYYVHLGQRTEQHRHDDDRQ